MTLPHQHHPGAVPPEERLPGRLVTGPGTSGKGTRYVVQGRVLGGGDRAWLVAQFPAPLNPLDP
ncbi:hypothetical protein ABZ726_35980, partial [Streptomyces hundungensis]|uniref:hypothetical protein n=1 Tax=Streptomyces hundungensis TaxID=1077946 RepID=UPI0034108D78